MCVQTANKPWERPAAVQDFPILAKHFPGVDFQGMHSAMSVDGCVPLTTDLVLSAAILASEEDSLGMRFLPFVGLDSLSGSATVVTIPEMDNIVEWMENTALGGHMWRKGSEWAERNHGRRIEFSMNCGAGSVGLECYGNGNWQQWVTDFNASRRNVYGRTNTERRLTIEGTDITSAQLMMWRRIRTALADLPAIATKTDAIEVVSVAA
ncbi:hypothetical protein COU18_02590 [Candidatus Kaiserbacteria bacterium CG10_big_fil_rev_8_21_14_0_10_51_14]|uniref:Uncharacterized protein n=1 Tax=Candidatus Kaiserbacteria bacterium CG10_big_fil_rev_8_21_14_0_10_51_14 TaxID=1974610 RepID=A0A2H0UAV8_9BACT|nr:MAG: hypothetical protein COU18_02590 [Candidatus Kaiserbacteria bacterium CG10_big_fil_rev_8_21_14_0_10_51_14]